MAYVIALRRRCWEITLARRHWEARRLQKQILSKRLLIELAQVLEQCSTLVATRSSACRLGLGHASGDYSFCPVTLPQFYVKCDFKILSTLCRSCRKWFIRALQQVVITVLLYSLDCSLTSLHASTAAAVATAAATYRTNVKAAHVLVYANCLLDICPSLGGFTKPQILVIDSTGQW